MEAGLSAAGDETVTPAVDPVRSEEPAAWKGPGVFGAQGSTFVNSPSAEPPFSGRTGFGRVNFPGDSSINYGALPFPRRFPLFR